MSKRSESPAAGSFLVRVWLETREKSGEARPARFYFRNLQTGEERYLADRSGLADALLRECQDRQESASALDLPADGTAG